MLARNKVHMGKIKKKLKIKDINCGLQKEKNKDTRQKIAENF